MGVGVGVGCDGEESPADCVVATAPVADPPCFFPLPVFFPEIGGGTGVETTGMDSVVAVCPIDLSVSEWFAFSD